MPFALRPRPDRRALAHHTALAPRARGQSLERAARRVLERNWVAAGGYTSPNRRRYPWLWLWDSCFHAIAWSAVGDERCVRELEAVLALQLPSGFVPHMGYPTRPRASLSLWHSPGRSDITQPPMYGHALRVLASRGYDAVHLHAPARAGLIHVLERRRDPGSGLLRVLHPWEHGADDSPRWDGWRAGPFDERAWNRRKLELVRTLELTDGAAAANPLFDVASAGFSALVAFNARELGELTGDADLLARARALAGALDARWLAHRRTWSDVCLAGPEASSAARTLDALLAVLVTPDARLADEAFAAVFDGDEFWRPHGPAGVAANEPAYDAGAYWRGDAWPQLTYLLMLAAERQGREGDAERLAERLVLGCIGSRFSERWNAETGAPLGARPQGWAALAAEGARRLDPV